MDLLIIAAVVLITLGLSWRLAIALGATEPLGRGLGVVQTIFTLVGIAMVAGWYFVEQPDAARLKFDQSVNAAPLGDGRALVNIEVTITNVGGHTAHFPQLPYKIFVQQMTPLPAGLKDVAFRTEPGGLGHVWDADDWETIAYRATGRAASRTYPNWDRKNDDGVDTTIEPNETENLYFAAAVLCQDPKRTPGLRLAVSSRFERPRTPMDVLLGKAADYWIKQSYLDLGDACAGKVALEPNKQKEESP